MLQSMKKMHSIHAARKHFSRLGERAEAGEEILIARRGTAVARLVPLRTPAVARRFGAMRGRAKVTAAFFAPLPDRELTAGES